MYDYYDDYSSGFDALEILSSLPDVFDKIGAIITLIAIVIGIVQCFWGYKYYRFTIALSGFVTGSTIGIALGLFFALSSEFESLKTATTFVIASMIICGAIGAIIAYAFELIGAFLVGFSGVYVVSLISSIIGKIASNNDNIASSFFTAAIPAVIAGIIIVKFWKPIVIIYTGLSGALSIAIATNFGFPAFLICAVGGIYYQIKSNNGLRDNKEKEKSSTTNNNNGGLKYKPLDPPKPNPQPIINQESTAKKDNIYPDIID